MEVLTRKLLELETKAEFKYHSRCDKIKLTHITLVDDINFFCKADLKSPAIIMKKFEEFSSMSGLKVNVMKSSMFFGGTSTTLKQEIYSS